MTRNDEALFGSVLTAIEDIAPQAPPFPQVKPRFRWSVRPLVVGAFAFTIVIVVGVVTFGLVNSNPTNPPFGATGDQVTGTDDEPDGHVDDDPVDVLAEVTLPLMTFAGLGGVEGIELSDLDRPVLMVLWAPWCLPCNSQVDIAEEVATAHPDMTVVGVAVETTGATPPGWTEDLENWLKEQTPLYPNYLDSGDLWKAINGYGLPVWVLVDSDNTAHMIYGVMDEPGLLAEIDLRP